MRPSCTTVYSTSIILFQHSLSLSILALLMFPEHSKFIENRAFRLIDCSVWNRFCFIFPWITIIQPSVLIQMPLPPKSLPVSLHLTSLIGLLTHFLIILVFFHLFYLLYKRALFVTCLFVPFHWNTNSVRARTLCVDHRFLPGILNSV